MWNDEDNNPYGAFDQHDEHEHVTASIQGSIAPRESESGPAFASALASAFAPFTLHNPWTLTTFSACIYNTSNVNSYKISC